MSIVCAVESSCDPFRGHPGSVTKVGNYGSDECHPSWQEDLGAVRSSTILYCIVIVLIILIMCVSGSLEDVLTWELLPKSVVVV